MNSDEIRLDPTNRPTTVFYGPHIPWVMGGPPTAALLCVVAGMAMQPAPAALGILFGVACALTALIWGGGAVAMIFTDFGFVGSPPRPPAPPHVTVLRPQQPRLPETVVIVDSTCRRLGVAGGAGHRSQLSRL